MRGGANGGRVRLAPQKDWPVNNPAELARVISKLEGIQAGFNRSAGSGKKVSLADLIVLGGTAAVEQAARAGGFSVSVPFSPGRTDASQEQTDVKSFAVLEPKADAFRNFYSEGAYFTPAEMLVERASLLGLSVPEMTALLGGLRVLDANTGGSRHGVLTQKPGTLSNDFFVNLLDMSTRWQKAAGADGVYEGVDRKSGKLKWTGTPVDLIFGSHSELRAIAEVYASMDGRQKFADDFARAWTKVMMADRFELKK
jgi:catalase-peroxidase